MIAQGTALGPEAPAGVEPQGGAIDDALSGLDNLGTLFTQGGALGYSIAPRWG